MKLPGNLVSEVAYKIMEWYGIWMSKLKVFIGFPLRNVIELFYQVNIALSLKCDWSVTQSRMFILFAFPWLFQCSSTNVHGAP